MTEERLTSLEKEIKDRIARNTTQHIEMEWLTDDSISLEGVSWLIDEIRRLQSIVQCQGSWLELAKEREDLLLDLVNRLEKR